MYIRTCERALHLLQIKMSWGTRLRITLLAGIYIVSVSNKDLIFMEFERPVTL